MVLYVVFVNSFIGLSIMESYHFFSMQLPDVNLAPITHGEIHDLISLGEVLVKTCFHHA